MAFLIPKRTESEIEADLLGTIERLASLEQQWDDEPVMAPAVAEELSVAIVLASLDVDLLADEYAEAVERSQIEVAA